MQRGEGPQHSPTGGRRGPPAQTHASERSQSHNGDGSGGGGARLLRGRERVEGLCEQHVGHACDDSDEQVHPDADLLAAAEVFLEFEDGNEGGF